LSQLPYFAFQSIRHGLPQTGTLNAYDDTRANWSKRRFFKALALVKSVHDTKLRALMVHLPLCSWLDHTVQRDADHRYVEKSFSFSTRLPATTAANDQQDAIIVEPLSCKLKRAKGKSHTRLEKSH
jgi:hypothetical protein